MSDIKCPYCSEEQEINHDDGYGYAESEDHEQECVSCDRAFIFHTSISYSYEPYCQPGDHEMEPWPDHFPMWGCKNCEYYERKQEQDL